MGANRFELLAGDCATSSFGLPYVHQLTDATPELPYIGISLHLDIGMLTRVVLDMPKHEDRWTCAVASDNLNGPVGDAFVRLVGLLATPDDVGALAPHYEFELYYRLLQSSMGDTLRQVGRRNDRFQQLKTAADWLATNHNEPIVIPELAASSGMSVTSFHRHFKAVTGFSPWPSSVIYACWKPESFSPPEAPMSPAWRMTWATQALRNSVGSIRACLAQRPSPTCSAELFRGQSLPQAIIVKRNTEDLFRLFPWRVDDQRCHTE